MIALLSVHLRQWRNALARRREPRQWLLLLALAVLFWLVIGYFSARVFGYLAHMPEVPDFFRRYLAEKILTMVLLTLYSLLVMSSLIASLQILFLSDDLPFLLSTPLRPSVVFAWKALLAGASSSALVVFAALPILFFYHRHFGSGGLSLALIALAFLLFLVLGVLPGLLLGLTVPALVSVRRLQPVLSVFSILIIAGLVIMLRLLRPERLMEPEAIHDLVGFVRSLDVPGLRWFPFQWAGRAMAMATGGQAAEAGRLILRIALVSAAGVGALALLQSRLYLPVLDRTRHAAGGARRSTWRKPRLCSPTVTALLHKEGKTFWRTQAQWTQLLVILALVVVFVLNMRALPIPHDSVRTLIGHLNFGLVLFIIAGLHSRFSFLALAGEGSGVILTAASPLPPVRFFRFKLLFYLLPQAALGVALLWIGQAALSPDRAVGTFGLFFLVPAVVWLGTLAVTLGFSLGIPPPPSPQQAIMSRPGLSYMLWSMVFVVACLAYQIRPLFLYYYSRMAHHPLPLGEFLLWMGLYPLICAGLTAVAMRRSQRRWERREF